MLLFHFLMFMNPIWNERYERLNYDDKDKVITVFGFFEEIILFTISLIFILKYFW